MEENGQEIGLAFIELLLRCHKSEKKLSHATGMSVEELLCIVVIHRDHPGCVKDLTEKLGVEGPRTSKLLRSLEMKGLVSRTASLPNRRTQRIALTPEGLRIVDKGLAFARSTGMAVLASLEPDDAQVLLRFFPDQVAVD